LNLNRGFEALAIVMKLCMITAVFVLLSACSDAVKIEQIEAFAIEILEENEEGIHERTGYKKSNSISLIVEGKNFIRSEIKSIEDFYDKDGNYIKTVIQHSKAGRTHVTEVEDGDNREKELQEPSTILIPDENIERFRSYELNDDEKKQVKEHVLTFMDKL
jgi:lipopolysaccharide export LptBFGC system permease protein LptF